MPLVAFGGLVTVSEGLLLWIVNLRVKNQTRILNYKGTPRKEHEKQHLKNFGNTGALNVLLCICERGIEF